MVTTESPKLLLLNGFGIFFLSIALIVPTSMFMLIKAVNSSASPMLLICSNHSTMNSSLPVPMLLIRILQLSVPIGLLQIPCEPFLVVPTSISSSGPMLSTIPCVFDVLFIDQAMAAVVSQEVSKVSTTGNFSGCTV